MKKIIFFLASIFLLQNTNSFAAINLTSPSLQAGGFAASGSTQYLVIMNALSNVSAENLSKSDVMVRFYDGTGNNPPCWTADKIIYHNDPYVAGAGGKNACGRLGLSPAGIVKIDIFPLKASAGKIYHDLSGVSIDASKFYAAIIIEQDTAPVFNENGTLKTPGTIKVVSIDSV